MKYDSIATEYQDYGTSALTEVEFGYKPELALLEPLSGKTVLDYGCGVGKFCVRLAERGATVHGVDTSGEMIRLARAHRGDRLSFYTITGSEALRNSPNTFDAVVLNFVLCTFTDKDEILKTLEHIRAAMKPGATLLVLSANVEECLGIKFQSFLQNKIEDPKLGDELRVTLHSEKPFDIFDTYWTTDFYIELLRRAGFTVAHIYKQKAAPDDTRFVAEHEIAPLVIIEASS